MRKRLFHLFLAACLLLCWIFYQNRVPEPTLMAELGNGINIGNSLDVYGLPVSYDSGEELLSEKYWGNPAVDRELFRMIREMGFKTVRIPVTWSDHVDENMTISDTWLARVGEVVEYALEEDLYVIINAHHEQWLNLDVNRAEEMEQKLRILWKQIAAYFKDCSLHLLFEGISEPRLKDSEEEWTAGTVELREMVNRLNRVFVKTVRDSDGKNRQRYLLVTPYCSQIGAAAISALEVPDDRCAVSLHLYYPYEFCQKEDDTVQWQEIWGENIDRLFRAVEKHLLSKGVPVIITEFGCIDKSNLGDRTAWTKAVAESAQSYGIHCIWWDNGFEYALMDRENHSWKYPEIAKQIIAAQD